MQVLGAATAGSTPTSGQTAATSGSSLTSATDPLTNEGTFLKLLTAQLKHQDPLNPSDPTQFIGQLVQFSQLEQLLGINQGVQNLVTKTTPTSPTSGTTAPSSAGGA
jgi:flagellar basal-body rod modification protein FlgD